MGIFSCKQEYENYQERKKENEAYNNKTRSINSRVVNINKVLEENKITLDELESKVKSDTEKLNGLFFLFSAKAFVTTTVIIE